ncbi:hypothetical protein CMO89_02770 [Candidatus Woesearchaeota archaeon]|nr:hypothetical protein [Candidatus Woesearchaeota archaeon]|tara:strand:- start:3567 stop:3956 length:390 start_codon:yes stop_codon:yes gene_type:complete
MKYKVVESKLKTNKSRSYLWNNMNSPEKIIKIEGYKNSRIKQVSDNNYEIICDYGVIVLNFIPNRGVNEIFVGKRNCPLTWFEIKGEKDCTITHGEYKRIDGGMSERNLKREIDWLKNHFLEELREIAK